MDKWLSQEFHAKLLKIHTIISHWSWVTKILAPGKGGHKKFFWPIGGRKNIAGVFSDIYDPPIPKKMVAP